MEIIKVFYSTSEEERLAKYRDFFGTICGSIGRILDVHLDVKYWRELAGGLGPSAQEIIDDRIGQYDIYFGIMGTKFGDGTEHEYRRAVENYTKFGRPIFVCFGFCEEKVNPYSIDPESLAKLIKFRKDIGDNKTYKVANLYFTFDDETNFSYRAEANLKEAIKEIKGRVCGGARLKP